MKEMRDMTNNRHNTHYNSTRMIDELLVIYTRLEFLSLAFGNRDWQNSERDLEIQKKNLQ